MFEVRETATFSAWFEGLKDLRARGRITGRLVRVSLGNLGDAKSVGDGVSELRIDHGPGYRVYFTRRGDRLVWLLCGGDKSSQPRDIARAKSLAQELRDDR
jgi:putative addiction module killer protein